MENAAPLELCTLIPLCMHSNYLLDVKYGWESVLFWHKNRRLYARRNQTLIGMHRNLAADLACLRCRCAVWLRVYASSCRTFSICDVFVCFHSFSAQYHSEKVNHSLSADQKVEGKKSWNFICVVIYSLWETQSMRQMTTRTCRSEFAVTQSLNIVASYKSGSWRTRSRKLTL